MVRKTVTYPEPRKLNVAGRVYTVAVKPEFTSNGVIPWCVDVDGNWYQVANYRAIDAQVPKEATHFLENRLQSADAYRGPAWLAEDATPLLISINGAVVKCRTAVASDGDTVWTFEYESNSSDGFPAGSDDTLDDIERMAAGWLRTQ
jgi:hypothetical protein